MREHPDVRIALRALPAALDPMPETPLPRDRQLAEETLPRFVAMPRRLHEDRDPALAEAVLAWLITRLGQITPLNDSDADGSRPPVYGYLDRLEATDGARIHLVHIAMDAQDLLWERDLAAVHNVLEAWRVGRFLYTPDGDPPVRLLLICADVDPDDVHEMARTLAIEPGQVLTGPTLYGFELPRGDAPEREWPELLFDADLGRRWDSLDEARRNAILGFLDQILTDPHVQPWMLVPVAATLNTHLPPAMREALAARLPQASSEAAALLARAHGKGTASDISATPATQDEPEATSAPVETDIDSTAGKAD